MNMNQHDLMWTWFCIMGLIFVAPPLMLPVSIIYLTWLALAGEEWIIIGTLGGDLHDQDIPQIR